MQEQQEQKLEAIEDGIQTWEKHDTVWAEIMQQVKTASLYNCPVCKKGRMHFLGTVMGHRVVPVPLE